VISKRQTDQCGTGRGDRKRYLTERGWVGNMSGSGWWNHPREREGRRMNFSTAAALLVERQREAS
jgi:hypothetical protein